MLDIQLWHLLI